MLGFSNMGSPFVEHFDCYPRVKDNSSSFFDLRTLNFLHC